jgi:hypothetical protein
MGPQRDHWRASHSEIARLGLELHILLAILDPVEVHRDRDEARENSAIFYREIDMRNDIMVAVSVSHLEHRANSIVTARKQRNRSRLKARAAFGLWLKKREG